MSLPHAAELMHVAELETSLSDWALDHTGTPARALEILVTDLNQHAGMHPRGEARLYRMLIETLTSRLKYIADRKRDSAWREEKIEAPIFILGLPRSGTTFLHNLMGSDPATRALRLFEMQFPSPRLNNDYARDVRIAYCQERLAAIGWLDEDYRAVHMFSAEGAEECVWFWDMLLLSVTFPALADIPHYQKFIFQQDFQAIYLEQRDFLKYLQHRTPRRRWVLKSPIHVRFLKEIIETFPDALFVHCHRDTAKIFPSIANLTAVLRSKFVDEPPGKEAVIGDYTGTWQTALAFRKNSGMAKRFFDMRFVDFRADPVGTVRAIYQNFDLSFSHERAAALDFWLETDKAERDSRKHHQYALADVGLTEADIDKMTGEYLAAFAVPLER